MIYTRNWHVFTLQCARLLGGKGTALCLGPWKWLEGLVRSNYGCLFPACFPCAFTLKESFMSGLCLAGESMDLHDIQNPQCTQVGQRKTCREIKCLNPLLLAQFKGGREDSRHLPVFLLQLYDTTATVCSPRTQHPSARRVCPIVIAVIMRSVSPSVGMNGIGPWIRPAVSAAVEHSQIYGM